MKYYIIHEALDKAIVGKYPQVEDAHYYCSIFEPRFIDHLNFQKTGEDPIVAHAILSKKAIPTDLLSAGIAGFHLRLLISNKLKIILEQHRNSGIQFYNTPIIYNNDTINEYWVVNMFKIDYEFVDIKRCEIVIRNRKPEGGTFLSSIDFKSMKDFLNRIEEDKLEGKLYMQTIVFKEDIHEDLIVLRYVDGGAKYFVSEKLKRIIEQENCSGIEFQPSNITFNDWLKSGGDREKIYGKI